MAVIQQVYGTLRIPNTNRGSKLWGNLRDGEANQY